MSRLDPVFRFLSEVGAAMARVFCELKGVGWDFTENYPIRDLTRLLGLRPVSMPTGQES